MLSPSPSARRGRRGALPAALLLPAALGLAGCGAAFTPQPPGAISLQATPAQPLHTGESFHLAATLAATGEPADVQWRIASANNAPALGPGTVTAQGIYAPPAVLSRDLVTVTLAAVDPAGTELGTRTLTVAPGFALPLEPENAALTPGSSLEVRAQLAEVSAGTVLWRLAGPSTQSDTTPAKDLGTLSGEHCLHSPRQFTTCTVTYTAPSAASFATGTAETRPILIATAGGSSPQPALIRAHLLIGTLNSNPALHQAEQRSPIALGGSGGNDNDFDTYADSSGARFVADCCGGTLGALVLDRAGTPFLLSNNHVLATSDQGHAGDTIEQPALIDDACVPLNEPGAQLQPIGSLRYAVPLSSAATNVDAALASLATHAVRADGAILELGVPESSAAASPTLGSSAPTAGTGEVLDAARLDGLSVVKSGRTTGLTCSSVDALDLRVAVDYYKDCAETQPYTTKIFTGQIGIGGEAFADSGDSGALVLDARNAEAIGLLYATGSSSTPGRLPAAGEDSATGLTLANPIGDVLAELGRQAGSPLTLAGSPAPHRLACLDYDHREASAARPSLDALLPDERARLATAVDSASTLRGPASGVLAVAPGTSADEPGAAAILVYLAAGDHGSPVPATIAGVRTAVIPTDLQTINRGPTAWPSAPDTRPGIHLAAPALASARAVAERLGPALMDIPFVFGVGVSQSLDDPHEPALLVLLESDATNPAAARALLRAAGESPSATATTLPAVLGGMRVRYERLHRFRVTRSKYVPPGGASSCSLHRLPASR